MNATPLNTIITVDAIANLNGLFSTGGPTPINGQTVRVLGYTTAYDAGDSWEVIYRSTGRTGITVDGGVYFVGPKADDYWEAADKSVSHIGRFGAVLNDTSAPAKAANVTAFTNALAASRTVLLQAGTYSLNATVTMPANTSIIGASRRASFVEFDSATTVAGIDMTDNCTLDNVRVRADAITTPIAGVRMVSADRATIRDCHIEQVETGLLIKESTIINIENTFILTCDDGIMFDETSTFNNVITIRGGEISSCDNAINLSGTTLKVSIHNVTIQGNNIAGIYSRRPGASPNLASLGLNIRDCYFEANTTHDIRLLQRTYESVIYENVFSTTPTAIQIGETTTTQRVRIGKNRYLNGTTHINIGSFSKRTVLEHGTLDTSSPLTIIDNGIDTTYLQTNGYVTPEQFGAIGDGVADDTTALQNALNANRTVRLQNNKSYLITAPLTITNSNQQLVGENQEGSEIRASNITGAAIAVSSANHVLLKNFKIWNSTAPTGCDIGISFSNVTDSKIEDILFADGILDQDAIYIEESWGIRIRDCKFYTQCTQSLIHVFRNAADASSNAITVEGCYSSSPNTPRGLWLDNTGIYPLGRTFNSFGNTWQLATNATGIQSKGAEGLTISGDYFEGAHTHHIRLGDNADASNGWTNTGTIHTCTFQNGDACITLEQCQAIDIGHQKFISATNQLVIGECTGCTYRGKKDFVSTATNVRSRTGIMIFEQDNHGPPSNPATDVPMGIVFKSDADNGTHAANEHYKLTIDSDGNVNTEQWIPSAKA